MKKFRLTTTLDLLRQHDACRSGYQKLLKSLGPRWPHDKPINLLRILKSNGVQDCIWCMRATLEDSTLPRVAIAAEYAKSVLKYFTKAQPNDSRVADCIKTCFAFVRGKATRAELDRAAWAAKAARDAGRAAKAARDAGRAAKAARDAAGAAWAAWAAGMASVIWVTGVTGVAGAAGAAGAAEFEKQAAYIRKWLR